MQGSFLTTMYGAIAWKCCFQAFSLRSKGNISLWAGDASRKYLLVFLRFGNESNWMSRTGGEAASDNLKMRVLDTRGCRISLSLCSTRQVCHLDYPPFAVVSGKCQPWTGDDGIAWLHAYGCSLQNWIPAVLSESCRKEKCWAETQ